MIYNGERRWRAPKEVAELIHHMPGHLSQYVPHLRYFLLDKGVEGEQSESLQGLMGDVIRLDMGNSPKDVPLAMAKLKIHLKGPSFSSLQRAFKVWIEKIVIQRVTKNEKKLEYESLEEIESIANGLFEIALAAGDEHAWAFDGRNAESIANALSKQQGERGLVFWIAENIDMVANFYQRIAASRNQMRTSNNHHNGGIVRKGHVGNGNSRNSGMPVDVITKDLGIVHSHGSNFDGGLGLGSHNDF